MGTRPGKSLVCEELSPYWLPELLLSPNAADDTPMPEKIHQSPLSEWAVFQFPFLPLASAEMVIPRTW